MVASEVVVAGSGGVRLFSKGRHIEGGDEKICQRYMSGHKFAERGGGGTFFKFMFL